MTAQRTERTAAGAPNAGIAAIVIPALDPGRDLPAYCRALRAVTDAPILLVDDGSRPALASVFDECAAVPGVAFVRHGANRGKGRALKTAFRRLLDERPDLAGCVTADADGQHTPADVRRCLDALAAAPGALVLGCRTFTLGHVPWRSRFGNHFIRAFFRLATGRRFQDTQTGLRGIPAEFMGALLDVPGERFDFETRMLLALGDRPLAELPIETVYEAGNPTSHFNPLRDSARILSIVAAAALRRLAAFLVASLASFALDLALASVLYRHVFREAEHARLALSVGIARAVSLVFNYLANRRLVFAEGRDGVRRHAFGRFAFGRYLLLAVALFGASYGLTKAAISLWPRVPMETHKAVVDFLLFFASFVVQRLFVFPRR